MIKVQEKHRARGLVLIAVHRQNVPKDRVLALCRAHKVNYSVYGSGSIKGDDSRGIPRAFLFDWKGEQVWSGHPASGMDEEIENALKGAPDWLLGPRKYVKVKAEASKVIKRRGMGAAAKTLRGKILGEDPETKAEAEELLGRLSAYAERTMKKAEACVENGEPRKAQAIWKQLARDFRGDEIGEKAAAKDKERARDPAFKREIGAARILARMEAVAGKIKPQRRGEDLSKWRKKNGGMLHQILAMYRSLEKKYGDTKVCKRAKSFARSMHVIE